MASNEKKINSLFTSPKATAKNEINKTTRRVKVT